ncbi:MAG: hypothetical protein ABII01_01245 [Candidatus Woesearchaeota archaeon]
MKKQAIYLIIALMIIASAHALTASIDKPKMVLYHNITDEGPLMFEESVIINNNNNYSVTIKLNPDSTLNEIMTLGEKEFLMQADERKEVFYNIIIDEAGVYQGDLIVKFTEVGNQVGAALAQTLVIIVADENGNVPTTTTTQEDTTATESDIEDTGDDKTPEPTPDTISSNDDAQEDGSSRSPLIGIFIILIIVVIGIIIYLSITKVKIK